MKTILAINAGSSSMKIAGYDAATGKKNFKATINAVVNYAEAIKQALRDVTGEVVGIGYRVVNGGGYDRPQIINQEVINNITLAARYAPLHNPAAVMAINMMRALYPQAKHLAVFDTSFFANMDEVAKSYALPETLRLKYLKFGYHGLSHENVAKTVEARSVISVHLGSGCSITAIQDGQPIETTLGFGTYDGLMMGTRSGAIDPAVVLDIARAKGIDATEKLLTQASGLAGVSGLPNDFRVITAEREAGNAAAELAYGMFIRSIVKAIGSMVALLDETPVLIFTGGIGENSVQVRIDVRVRVERLIDSSFVVQCDEEGIIFSAVQATI